MREGGGGKEEDKGDEERATSPVVQFSEPRYQSGHLERRQGHS